MEIELIRGKIAEKRMLSQETTATDLALTLKLTAPQEALCCSINGSLVDLNTVLQEGDQIEFISFDDPIGKDVYWHTSAHVLAQAVLRLWPDAQPTIGPSIEEGFYYDFANLTVSDDDFPKIEKEMKKIVAENHKPVRHLFEDASQALHAFEGNPYKKELVEELSQRGGGLTSYSQGEFADLCRGPHLPSLSKIKAISLLKTSGAYWRGDANNAMLTRIYGSPFQVERCLKSIFIGSKRQKSGIIRSSGQNLVSFPFVKRLLACPSFNPRGWLYGTDF